MKRKRGAQPGNSNAFKHGLYSACFSKTENELLANLSPESFTEERELLRVAMKRALEELSKQPDLTLAESFAALRTFSLAAAVLERLHRSEQIARRLASHPPLSLTPSPAHPASEDSDS